MLSNTAPPTLITANLAGWDGCEADEKILKWRSTSRLLPSEYNRRVIVS